MNQHEAYREDYEEGGDSVMDLLHFADDESWLGSPIGAQSDDLIME